MKPSLMIHGGAGVISEPGRFSASLRRIVEAGSRRLADGAAALDVVEGCVAQLEDDPLYNAGRGAALNADGRPFCDASIMDGRTLAAGAVAGVLGPRNPVRLARLVMERTPHVFMVGAGAEALGRRFGLACEPESYFVIPERVAALDRARARGKVALDHAGPADGKLGTVGAVARDAAGNLAAATSTGGLTNQTPGRVGDSPVIGAGVYADNLACAVSCTGVGEQFLRTALARVAAFFVEAQGMDAPAAARAAIDHLVARVSGSGGLIIVDRDGACGVAHSTTGMLWALAQDGDIRLSCE
jgi:beta-aspartyl-peptidase (threonine type)